MRSADREVPGRIVGLDGLRAVSILLVIVGHAWATIPSPGRLGGLAPYLGNASMGVTTFFVVSGFLITYLLRREWEKSGTIWIRAFYARRVLRIFPALYTYLAVMVLLRATGAIQTTWGDLGIAGTFLTNYKHVLPIPTNDDYWFVGHFWTLSLEEQFYLFWPATILAVGLLRARTVALLIVVASPFVRIATYFLWPEVRGQLSIMLHTAADPIMIGCLAALWQGGPRFEGILRRFSAWYWPVLATVFALFVSPWLALRFRGMYYMTAGMTLNGVAIAFIMLWVIRHPDRPAVRILSSPLLRHVGVLSYSLYLWQQLFLTSMNRTWTGTFPLNLLACVAAAELSYWVVERPFLKLRDNWRRARPGAAPDAAAPVVAARDAAVAGQ